jgi:ABC-type glycerol-3-phosphate transport system permease component
VSPRRWRARLGHRTLVVIATVYCLFPIYFMLVQSLKTAQEDVFGNPLIVTNPTFERVVLFCLVDPSEEAGA